MNDVYKNQLSLSIIPFHFSGMQSFGKEKIENSAKAALQLNINFN